MNLTTEWKTRKRRNPDPVSASLIVVILVNRPQRLGRAKRVKTQRAGYK